MKIFSATEYPQAGPEWWNLRRGVPTASGFDRILTAKTLKPSTQQDGYIDELLADINLQCPPYFTGHGKPVNTYAMQNGKDAEPEARAWFGLETGLEVVEVGFCKTDDDRFGCSPDGLIHDAEKPIAGLELKVPLLKTHIGYLREGGLPADYKAQVHGSLIVTGLPHWWFMSYGPGADQLLIKVEPDSFTEALRAELDRFWVKYQAALDRVYPERKAIVEVEAAFRDWLLRIGDNLELFNAGLIQDLAPLSYERKRAAWHLCKAHASARGWILPEGTKQFVRPEEPAF